MKKIIITGASRGIGAELAQQLAPDHDVLLLSRDLKRLQELKLANPRLMVEYLDLSLTDVRSRMETIIANHFTEVDALINNAGYLVSKPILEISHNEIQQSFATNVTGLIEACQAVVPFMEKNGGHIVNIGSMGGFQGSVKFPGLAVYSATKAAVAGFSEALSEELKQTGIRVNCLALGAAQTEMLNEAFPGYKAPVSAHEMAEFIADFTLRSHRWINGKTIPVSLSTP